MDLTFDDETEEFRAEVRDFLASNKDKFPTKSYDTLEGFEQHRVWDKVRDVHCEYHYVTYRRQALQELRELVGPRAYYTGQLPPHVPLWRIPVAD